MKHKPEQLAGMSDGELNKILAEITEDYCWFLGSYHPDYCTDWAATGPLMVEHAINLNKLKCEINWLADKCDSYARSTNPLRAVVECLILVLQENE